MKSEQWVRRRKPPTLTSRCPSEEEAGIVMSEQWVRRRKAPTLTSRCPSEEEAGIVKSEQWVRRRKAPTLTSRFPSHAQEEAGIEQWVWRRKPPILTCGFPSEEEAGMLSGFVDSSSETNTDMASEDELMSGFVTSEWESTYEQCCKKCRTDGQVYNYSQVRTEQLVLHVCMTPSINLCTLQRSMMNNYFMIQGRCRIIISL